jgi:ribosomal protein L37AE/L43A
VNPSDFFAAEEAKRTPAWLASYTNTNTSYMTSLADAEGHTCSECGKPVYRVHSSGRWMHRECYNTRARRKNGGRA